MPRPTPSPLHPGVTVKQAAHARVQKSSCCRCRWCLLLSPLLPHLPHLRRPLQLSFKGHCQRIAVLGLIVEPSPTLSCLPLCRAPFPPQGSCSGGAGWVKGWGGGSSPPAPPPPTPVLSF